MALVGDRVTVVDLAHALWQLTKIIKQLTDILKERLRQDGITVLRGMTGTVTFDGSNGEQCVVHIPGTRPQLRRGLSLPDIMQSMGVNVFHTLFDMSPRPVKDFQEKLSAHGPESTAKILSVVDLVDAHPRITFR